MGSDGCAFGASQFTCHFLTRTCKKKIAPSESCHLVGPSNPINSYHGQIRRDRENTPLGNGYLCDYLIYVWMPISRESMPINEDFQDIPPMWTYLALVEEPTMVIPAGSARCIVTCLLFSLHVWLRRHLSFCLVSGGVCFLLSQWKMSPFNLKCSNSIKRLHKSNCVHTTGR